MAFPAGPPGFDFQGNIKSSPHLNNKLLKIIFAGDVNLCEGERPEPLHSALR
jgi:hypothetical protein